MERKAIKFKKKSSAGDTAHIFVTPIHDKSGTQGYEVVILTLTKHPEIYKHDYILRLFKGYAITVQITRWAESTLRGIVEAINTIKKDSNNREN